MRDRAALAVMARYPQAGTVKTRLARVIGAEPACRLYSAFLRDIEARFSGKDRALVWVYEPPDAAFSQVVTPGARCIPQKGNGLGERMHNCFRHLCNAGFAPVVMIGADVPHVRAEWLDEAEESLARADVVVGPSDDGGYYLVAMRTPHDVFSGIEMSTNRVLAQTLRRVAALGLEVHLLPQTFDIDEAHHLVQLRRLLDRGDDGLRLPFTAEALQQLRL